MYINYYLLGIIVLPGILLALFAQTKVQTTFQKYATVFSNLGDGFFFVIAS